eukprot:CAMPEP_0202439574 /NCGR_PEP_ID=MMETSP1345-20130828/36234_1 /ASSEMBLY_ACC=CAM_ASM_000843 /TAXON_ID=342563 /ORGANISM="Fabrea Fabrea salina" /LENGTH=321 /DNA_ID=CAMNT_0049054109 /DNA_START=750 /DNA_END=1715 /DNA_ORIENTATION=-
MTHWYLMNYISHFSKIYKGANQWIYAHFDTAHEITGQQGQALDDDLVEFLKNYFKAHSEDANVVVYLVADHGMRFGNFGTDPEAIQEHRLPAFFLLTPKSILNSIDSPLAHNSQKLTTKGDLRRSIFFLVKWQTGLDIPSASQYYDLFSERIPDNRTCKDAHIPEWFCCTNVMHPISSKVYLPSRLRSDEHKEMRDVLDTIAHQMVLEMNESTLPAEELCRRLEFGKTRAALYKELDSSSVLFRVAISVRQKTLPRFNAWVITSGTNDTGLFPITYKGVTVYAKLIYTERQDSFKGKCERLAQSFGVNPRHCLCRKSALDI